LPENQESAGGERGEPERTGAVWSSDPVKDAGAFSQAGVGNKSALAAPEIAGPRSALKGHSVQWEGRTLLPGASPGEFSAVCCRPVALQISEDSAGTFGLAFASSGQNALSAIPASAIQAAMRLRERCAIMAAFLAQMRAFCQA
jgi:hypothetical protein